MVEAPIVRVELFEDRAAVTRRVTIPSAGRHTLEIGPLSPWLSGRTVTFPGGAGATLEEVRVERDQVERGAADPAALSGLELAVRTGEDVLRDAVDRQRRASERVARTSAALEAARAASGRGLAEHDAPLAWVDVVAELARERREARIAEHAAALEVTAREAEQRKRAQDLAAGRTGRPVVRARLVLGILAEQAGELLIRYVVPCAAWRPTHRATLVTHPRPRVTWALGAACWNATGESWDGVELVCSTARPGDDATPPALVDDVVRTQRRDPAPAVEAREEEIHLARERGGPTSEKALGVDDGGEPRTFAAREVVTLPSDGRPVTVELDGWSADATTSWLALPERAAEVVLRTVCANAGARPLLAGPVELVRDGVSIGRGRVDLVPPGEPFPLGWGTHDGVRISRRQDHEQSRARLTGRVTHTFSAEIRVVHLGAEVVTLEVRERVPTSELVEVTVSAPSAEPALDRPVDADGMCRWTVTLAPGATRTLKLTYTVEASHNVHLPF